MSGALDLWKAVDRRVARAVARRVLAHVFGQRGDRCVEQRGHLVAIRQRHVDHDGVPLQFGRHLGRGRAQAARAGLSRRNTKGAAAEAGRYVAPPEIFAPDQPDRKSVV